MSWKAKIDHEDCQYVTEGNTERAGLSSKWAAYEWAKTRLNSHDANGTREHEKLTITITKECDHHAVTGQKEWAKAAREFVEKVAPLPGFIGSRDVCGVYYAVVNMKNTLETCQACGERL